MSANRIVHQVTLKYLLQNRKRSLISLISISLMVILLTGVFNGKDTAIRFFTDIAEAEKGKWHINVYDIDNEQYEKLKELPFVEETGISSHLAISPFAESGNAYKPYLDLRSYSKNSFDWMNIRVTEGRLPENDGEIILSEALIAGGSDVQIGDSITFTGITRTVTNSCDYQKFFPYQQIMMEPWESMEVDYDFPYYPNNPEITETTEPTGFEKEYRVVGFMEVPLFESSSSAVCTAITYSEEIPENGKFNCSLRVNEDDTNLYQSINEIAPHQFEANNYALVFHGQSSSYTINRIVIVMQGFLTVLILVIAAVLMNNVFALSYDERLKYLGMLTSIGATGRQKRSSVYFEAAVLLALALPVGFALGLIVVKAAVSFMRGAAAAFMGMHLTQTVGVRLVLKPGSVLAVILFSILTVFVSAFLPARRISKIGPVASIRGNENGKNGRVRKTKEYSSAETMLAAGFLKKDRRRSSAIVKALCAFITVMITVTYASAALIRMADIELGIDETAVSRRFNEYEYMLMSDEDNEMYRSLVSMLEETGGIEQSESIIDYSSVPTTRFESFSSEFQKAYLDVMRRYYPEDISDEEFIEQHVRDTDFFCDMMAVDDAFYERIASKLDYVHSDEKTPEIIVLNNGFVSTDYFYVFGKTAEEERYYEISDMCAEQPGETISFNLFGHDVQMYIGAKADLSQLKELFTDLSAKMTFIMRISDAEKLMKAYDGAGGESCFLFDGDESNKNFANVLSEIRNLQSEEIQLLDHEEYLPETIKTSINSLIRILMISFTIFTSAVCFLNIFNSVSGLISYRRKTFAILRANGMTEGQLRKSMMIEMSVICLKGILYASAVSLILCFGINTFMMNTFGSFTVPVPYAKIILIILAAAVMCFISEWYTYRKETDTNLMEEIRKDSI
ncbi:MAG: FtsX-like permease family protein [Erysipelotrichaceae bacterium]|nr:FtsX-like permease family protein [Erysipelotrichaceae bacterium]